MRAHLIRLSLIGVVALVPANEVLGWGRGGFGGYRGGGSFGGYRGGGFGGYRAAGGYGGDRWGGGGYREGSWSGSRSGEFDRGGYGGSYSGERSGSAWGGRGAGGYEGSYDRSYTGSRGGSVSSSGAFDAIYGPRGAAAGGTRDVTATGPEGRTYSSDSARGAVRGPAGNVYAGGSRSATAAGPNGSVSRNSAWAAAGGHFPGDYGGLARYSSVHATGVGGTASWSRSYTAGWANDVRGGFVHYDSFTPAWCTAHPLAWTAPGWGVASAWSAPAWASLADFAGIDAPPQDYDYGNTVVYQGDNVYVNGTDAGTADQYAQQADQLATQGQEANPPPQDQWKSLGVYALVQGQEKTSNSVFQLAVNQAGIIRGNFYDGLMDTTTAVYGKVDPKTQRAAWTIGDKKEPVFDCGFYNLTRPQTPVLAHFGGDRTEQWLLVRMKPKGGQASPAAKSAPALPPGDNTGTATVTVIVPEGARVFFDGVPTTQTGTRRQFTTPPLEVGNTYSYEIVARWTAPDGSPVRKSRKADVKAGAEVEVDFLKRAPEGP